MQTQAQKILSKLSKVFRRPKKQSTLRQVPSIQQIQEPPKVMNEILDMKRRAVELRKTREAFRQVDQTMESVLLTAEEFGFKDYKRLMDTLFGDVVIDLDGDFIVAHIHVEDWDRFCNEHNKIFLTQMFR